MRWSFTLSLPTLALACVMSGAMSGAPPAEAAADTGPVALDRVLIEQRPQAPEQFEQPVSITSLGARDMAELRATSLETATQGVPNLNVQQKFGPGSGPQWFLRGQDIGAASFQSDIRANFYLDDVLLGRLGAMSTLMLADLCGMEALRGPQGAGQGLNAAAGAIRLTSCFPAAQAGARLAVDAGTLGHRQFKLALDSGERGGFSSRLVLLRSGNDGWVANETPGVRTRLSEPFGAIVSADRFGAVDDRAVALRLGFEAAKGLKLGYQHGWSDRRSTQMAVQLIATYGGLDALYSPAAGFGGTSAQLTARNSVAADFTGTDRQRVSRDAVTVDHALSRALQARYVLATQRMAENAGGNDLDAASFTGRLLTALGKPTPASDRVCYLCSNGIRSLRQTTSEMTLAFGADHLSWTAGLSAMDESGRADSPTLIGAVLVPDQLNTLGSLSRLVPSDYDSGNQIEVRNRTLAAFARARWTVADELTLSAGLRHTRDKRQTATLRSAGAPSDARTRHEYNDGELALLRQFGRQLNGYVRLATAHVAGGTEAGLPFAPELDRGAEAGLKFATPDQRLRLNAAVFQTRVSHRQIENFSSVHGVYIVDAGTARQRGLELELHAQVLAGLRLHASYGLVRTRLSYNFHPLTPAQTLHLGVQQDFASFANGLHARLRVDANWRGRAAAGSCLVGQSVTPTGCTGTGEATLTEAVSLPAQTGVSARMGLAGIPFGSGMRGELALWGRNLLDSRRLQFARDMGNGTVIGTFPEPRTVGVSLSAGF